MMSMFKARMAHYFEAFFFFFGKQTDMCGCGDDLYAYDPITIIAIGFASIFKQYKQKEGIRIIYIIYTNLNDVHCRFWYTQSDKLG